MSARAENWVLELCIERRALRPVHCHVLQLLAIRHDHDCGIAWPSIARMSVESHYTERAIYKALDELSTMGLVHRSYGELPRKSRRERVKFGNRYAFPGLDEIIEDEGPRLLGGRHRIAGDEPGSPEPDDVQMNGQMNLATPPDERPEAGQMNGAAPPDERDVTTRDGVDEPETHVTPERTYRTGQRDRTETHGERNSRVRARDGSIETKCRCERMPQVLLVDGHLATCPEAPPRHAEQPPSAPIPATPTEPVEQRCPLGNHTFSGSYSDHLANEPRHKVTRAPPRRPPRDASESLVAGEEPAVAQRGPPG